MNIISVQEALEKVLNDTKNFGIEEVSFMDSFGRILKEDILADRDFPPFNRVSMDGIALNSEAFNKGKRAFKIEGIQPAGSKQLTLQHKENCLEVMTGAVLPKNTDAVIQYELLSIENGIATLHNEHLKDFQNIHKKGFDRKKASVLIKKNTLISAAEIGVLATVGKQRVKVAKQPKVMIISTGDELVEVSEFPKNYQIRRSNVYALEALLLNFNIKAETAHIKDEKQILTEKIDTFLKQFDVLIFSGAVSKGKFDFIPEVLNELGVTKLFHSVKQRPGKPFWFGKKVSVETNQSDKTVFAFPGNPVSTFVSCLKYFYPWYYKSAGLSLPNYQAVLTEDFDFKPELTYFLQVKLQQKDGLFLATPIKGKGSGDLANLIEADAFLELPSDKSNFTKGEVFPVLTYRSL